MRVIATDVLDKDGNLGGIEYYDELGGFQFQAVWDPDDEQTAENRKKFREWANLMAKRMDYEVIE